MLFFFYLKQGLKKIVANILQLEARLILNKYRPRIVGITGSVGKTSTKDAVAIVLASQYRIRKSEKSYNSELGVPLTILGSRSAWNDPLGWVEIIVHGLMLLIFRQAYPEWLVLEIGADHPGDIKKIASWIKFDIVVITRLPDIPVHIEFFKSKEQLVEEKTYLLKTLGPEAWAILNFDDEVVKSFADTTKGQVLSYGFNPQATVIASNDQLLYKDEEIDGLTFKIDYQGGSLPIRLYQVLSRHQISAALAAFAVGASQGLNPVLMLEALTNLVLPPGRLNLIEGIKNSILLDDTYNASPVAMEAGLDVLEEIKVTGRKIAVLGDMLELGSYTVPAHRAIGTRVGKIVEHLILIGLRSKFIAEGAEEGGLDPKNIHHFDEAEMAGKFLEKLIKTGDLVYLKGSQGMRLEKVVEEVMAHPEDKEKLLCRQEKEWQKR
ncbi:MAG: hypothetical protein COX02_00025 [Candidatus Vogelbacteria bacterium CG22_combo_CG10-13_8_21_14_all_37_9]|uniref:UDP-N-acetylmuramoyl-tripeptide--D-alanyl-D-alanine ligase n=1 Tax=Candidatus Vogelbacteria bacterium CG22_combo_CG10-13_8_21_14_all_37_9 TaxID=1975046 RepID=A0A2H0BLJ6_9BACT|nr:MAG: hypothetical protein COX02_00025 [Candidatus Vogelbacteria bacterium CG22_combo_CG10-13_8_21_14_all_37_9]